MTVAVLLTLLGALSRLIPHPPNAVALGALALYSGARLPRRWAVAVPLGAMALSDFFLDFGTGRALFSGTRLTIYATFAAIVFAGRRLGAAARTGKLVAFSLAASLLFFATSNFAVWALGHMYPKTPAGLLLCYAAAVPFLWNTLAADLVGVALLFSLDALARRARERVAAATTLVASGTLLLAAATAQAQQPAPVSESIVITATAFAEEEEHVGAATTVITRERIEQAGFRTVAEVLRSVPGVDIVRSGSDGSVTSIFLRGSNSTHTLVLVDGARVNSPFFSGYDFSALTTENIERIEIVRGPFSALYGSDALGGVVQIFTRPVSLSPTGQATAEAGDAGQRNGSVFFSAGRGPLAAAASYRHARVSGDRANADWREENGSLKLEGRLGEALRVAVEGSILDGEVGIPGPVGKETPRARGGFREERIALPATFHPTADHEMSLLVARVVSKPSFRDPDSTFRFSDTDARTWQARASDTWKTGPQILTVLASWEQWTVDNRSNFGVNLDGDRSTVWAMGFQDTLRLGRGWIATAGLRYDHHSEFGRAWSPRATVSWLSADVQWKVRGSVGRAFRAPSVGELRFPFSGNPNLQPERSTSYELGAERYFGTGRLEVSLFWNDFQDLILFDFATSMNQNIGRGRTRGVELALREDVSKQVAVDVGYTYLDAKNRLTGGPLPRRPRHRAYFGGHFRPWEKLTVSPRVTFVGRRPDVDALTFGDTEDPSYLRCDLFARYELRYLAPYLRFENLTDRRYEEANGFPAPRRRYALGLEAKF